MQSITILIPYFGKFPEWSDLYFETVRRNSTINFIFYTDCDFEKYKNMENCRFKKMTFQEYIDNVRKVLKLNFSPANAYKLCDLRPLYPIVHYEDIKNSDFYGWTDMDLLFGDIRSFYTDEILSRYEVLSTHNVRISGHLAIFKNTKKNRNIYKNIYDWKNKLLHPYFVGIDEHGITNAFTMTFFDKLNEKFHVKINKFFTIFVKRLKTRKLYMVEQYTTPFTTIPWIDGTINSQQPDTWFYKDGVVTNSRDCNRNFMYIHFMNFKNSQYRHDGTKAPWENKDIVCFASVNDMKKGITINNDGIFPLK
ncbi:MAG: hypothetical protein FWC39_00145 [Bacteroidetes bacterium]|nr:hypothetical protein [Bacteroidota bacterium]